ncbi:hypothetical protein WMY93_031303 [Mugilogobius chulae]|uniref:Uncharacterized protein n=1 Tax=Mugilogobius chulae TaxID=88201 RepID=A0AAW0MIG2_9GOBI
MDVGFARREVFNHFVDWKTAGELSRPALSRICHSRTGHRTGTLEETEKGGEEFKSPVTAAQLLPVILRIRSSWPADTHTHREGERERFFDDRGTLHIPHYHQALTRDATLLYRTTTGSKTQPHCLV